MKNCCVITALMRVFFFCFPVVVCAESQPLNIAVASNFVPTMKKIAKQFNAENSQVIQILSGSTGKHYLQISYGAPIDIFFAADQKRPAKLVESGKASQTFTYAIGKLAYWLPKCKVGRDNIIDSFAAAVMQPVKRMSLANPKHAPYGKAAQETLKALSLWQIGNDELQFVFAENASQSYNFIKTQAVSSGFVAYSQIKQNSLQPHCVWQVPNDYYQPIRQDAVVIKPSAGVQEFLEFFSRTSVQQIIKDDGYDLP